MNSQDEQKLRLPKRQNALLPIESVICLTRICMVIYLNQMNSKNRKRVGEFKRYFRDFISKERDLSDNGGNPFPL